MKVRSLGKIWGNSFSYWYFISKAASLSTGTNLSSNLICGKNKMDGKRINKVRENMWAGSHCIWRHVFLFAKVSRAVLPPVGAHVNHIPLWFSHMWHMHLCSGIYTSSFRLSNWMKEEWRENETAKGPSRSRGSGVPSHSLDSPTSAICLRDPQWLTAHCK